MKFKRKCKFRCRNTGCILLMFESTEHGLLYKPYANYFTLKMFLLGWESCLLIIRQIRIFL